jgi:hypothetical protein
LWVTENEKRDPVNSENLLLAQHLKCPFCDERQRVICIYRPNPTTAEDRSA